MCTCSGQYAEATCAALQNQFDSIDLSDNAIVRLEGFPKLHRLKMLLLNNNRIVRIAPHLEGELVACFKQQLTLQAW